MRLNWQKVEEIMADRRMPKQDLARRLRRSPSAITRLQISVRAGREIEPYTVGRLAKALGVAVANLVDAPLPRRKGTRR